MTDKTLATDNHTQNGSNADHEAEALAKPRTIDWDDPNLIHTYNDEKGNLIMPASWRDEGDACDDGLYS